MKITICCGSMRWRAMRAGVPAASAAGCITCCGARSTPLRAKSCSALAAARARTGWTGRRARPGGAASCPPPTSWTTAWQGWRKTAAGWIISSPTPRPTACGAFCWGICRDQPSGNLSRPGGGPGGLRMLVFRPLSPGPGRQPQGGGGLPQDRPALDRAEKEAFPQGRRAGASRFVSGAAALGEAARLSVHRLGTALGRGWVPCGAMRAHSAQDMPCARA